MIPNGWATVLSDDDFVRIWKGIRPESETFKAVQQLLARETISAIAETLDPSLADKPGATAQMIGNCQALTGLAAKLLEATERPERWTAIATAKHSKTGK